MHDLERIHLDISERLKICPTNSLISCLAKFLAESKRDLLKLNKLGLSKKVNELIVSLFYERHLKNHFHFEKNKDYESMADYFNRFLRIESPFEEPYLKLPFDSTLKVINAHIDKETKNGCYIATMAYGDYDHPRVIELRKFRDNYLSKSSLGRHFIKFYYKNSPNWVEKLKNKTTINQTIRYSLNMLISIIKK